MKPWRDVYSLDNWNSVVAAYQAGNLGSASVTTGRQLRSLFKRDLVLPQQVQRITASLRAYQAMLKTDLASIPGRMLALLQIADAGDEYIRKYRITATVKQGREGDTFSSLDGFVWSISRRARRKAAYIQKLFAFYHDSTNANAVSNAGLINYVVSPENIADGLVNIVAAERMEALDPAHRNFAMSGIERDQLLFDPNDTLSYAFLQWAGITQEVWTPVSRASLTNAAAGNTNPPFFLWLEGHPICLGPKDSGPVPIKAIGYADADLKRGKGLDIIWCAPSDTGQLMEIRLDDLADQTSIRVPRVFQTLPGRFQGKARAHADSAAYVWTVGREIFVGHHRAEAFHHSSFVSGRRVRCAGMINARAGKVSQVSNDSGHYRPTAHHLRAFVLWLQQESLLAPNALVKCASEGFPNAPLTVAAFLAHPIV